MNDTTRKQIRDWIFANHEHHEGQRCVDNEFPYVNSKKLEEFIMGLDATGLASPEQRKFFFALGNQLSIEPTRLKERAKKKFGLESFTTITTAQLSELIDALQLRLESEMIKCPNCRGTGFIPRADLEKELEFED